MKLTPKDFFINAAIFVTLYVSVFSFLALLFEYIDRVFPSDLGGYRDPYSSGISFALASLIVIFPLYLFFTRMYNKDVRKHSEKRELGIRRWLIFITLFLAGGAVVIDLIVLLNTFLSGQEITTGFILKVVAVLVVVGGVFWYYLKDFKGKWEREESSSKKIGGVVALLVLISVVAGFFIMGSPQANRLTRIDAERVRDLQSIQWQIIDFWQKKERIPSDFAELEDPLVGFILPTDPQTGNQYEYERISSLTFALCATFDRESPDTSEALVRPLPIEKSIVPGVIDGNWEHGAGRTCFERTIDPERFPQINGRI